MSPNDTVLDAKSELLLVFATVVDLANSSKYSSVKMFPPTKPTSPFVLQKKNDNLLSILFF